MGRDDATKIDPLDPLWFLSFAQNKPGHKIYGLYNCLLFSYCFSELFALFIPSVSGQAAASLGHQLGETLTTGWGFLLGVAKLSMVIEDSAQFQKNNNNYT